jgi:hypothetical protein
VTRPRCQLALRGPHYLARFVAFTFLNATDVWQCRRCLPLVAGLPLEVGLAALSGCQTPLVVEGLFPCGLPQCLCKEAALYRPGSCTTPRPKRAAGTKG